MKTTPEFTDAEIQAMMDFGQVLSIADQARRRSRKIVRRIASTVLITAIVGGSLLVYKQYSSLEPGNISQPSVENNSSIGTPQKSTPNESVPPSRVAVDSTRQSANPKLETGPRKKPAQQPLAVDKKEEAKSTIRIDSARSAFVPAEPVAGYDALYEYFAKELRYPKEAIKDSIQGVIFVSFVINVEGKPEQVATDHALGEAFHAEAVRVIEQMPVWKPAQLDGSPVRSKVSVPITFSVKTARQQ